MSDVYDDDLEHAEEEAAPRVRDPGGVPTTLTHQPGFRSVSPLVGFGGAALVALLIGSVLWSLVFHPRATVAAASNVPPRQSQETTAQNIVPDPTPTPLGHPRTHPVFAVAHVAATHAPVTVSAETTTVAYIPPQEAQPSVPRVRTGEEMTADDGARRLAESRRASSRMQLETQDAQAQRDLAGAGGSSAPAASPMSDYPTQAAPNAPTESTFVSENGSGSAPPHGAFIAQHSGDPGYQAATSRYELVAGTIIPARLITAIDSTVPGGVIKAEIVESIFDSATHSVVVVPRGTTAIGSSDSAQSGEARLVASWTELYLPNGRKFFASSNGGAGAKGEAGMAASVDTHAGRAFGNALVSAVLQAGVGLANRASTVVNIGSAATTVQQPPRLAPTLHAYPGQLFNIVLNHDLPLERYVP